MSVAFRIVASPPPGPRPAQPSAVDPLRILELRVRAEMLIKQIDHALQRPRRTEDRAADERSRDVPVEYSGAQGRVLGVR